MYKEQRKKRIIMLSVIILLIVFVATGVIFGNFYFDIVVSAEEQNEPSIITYMNGVTKVTKVDNIQEWLSYGRSSRNRSQVSSLNDVYLALGFDADELSGKSNAQLNELYDLTDVTSLEISENYITTQSVDKPEDIGTSNTVTIYLTKEEAYRRIEEDVKNEDGKQTGYIKSTTIVAHTAEMDTRVNKDNGGSVVSRYGMEITTELKWISGPGPANRWGDLFVVAWNGAVNPQVKSEMQYDYITVVTGIPSQNSTVKKTDSIAMTTKTSGGTYAVGVYNLPDQKPAINPSYGSVSTGSENFVFRTTATFDFGLTPPNSVQYRAAWGHHFLASASLTETVSGMNISINPGYSTRCYTTDILTVNPKITTQ